MRFVKKIEYFIFILLLFLQNFALITTSEFGINGLVCFLFFISFFQFKKYYGKIKKNNFLLVISAIMFIFFSSIINDTFYISQILRYIMVIWLIFISNIYIKNVFENGHKEYFLKIYLNFLVFFLIYGIYEWFANKYYLPLYLNIFGNNPSYEIKTLYRYYGGWINKPRLYNTFFEPSVFSLFLVYNFFFVKEIECIKVKKKKYIYGLILFNLYFTYARTGYITMIYMLIIYFIYEKILKNIKNVKIVDFIVLFLPIINLCFMYYIGLLLFDDLSSLSRTYSPIYYLKQSIINFKYIVFGHSTGSTVNDLVTELYVENQAHNGYVDIIYQFGYIVFTVFFLFVYSLLQKKMKNKYLILGILATFCCFSSYFNVETIAVLIVLIYNFCCFEEKEKSK